MMNVRFPLAATTAFLPVLLVPATGRAAGLDASTIAKAVGRPAKTAADGVVRISWARKVAVEIDGKSFPASAGIGVWAAFKPAKDGTAVAMSNTALFRDEVDAALDTALAHGLQVTALHNHFFYDRPKVYFLHTQGKGDPKALASAYGPCGKRSRRSERSVPNLPRASPVLP